MKGKSFEYQYKIMEIITDPVTLAKFSNEDGINHYFNCSSYSEEVEDLRTELTDRLREIMDETLTTHQKQVLLLFLDGNTQEEIGQAMNIHQTGVHKAIFGNIDYKFGGKRYGGVVKKLRKKCEDDDKIQSILSKIIKLKKQLE